MFQKPSTLRSSTFMDLLWALFHVQQQKYVLHAHNSMSVTVFVVASTGTAMQEQQHSRSIPP